MVRTEAGETHAPAKSGKFGLGIRVFYNSQKATIERNLVSLCEISLFSGYRYLGNQQSWLILDYPRLDSLRATVGKVPNLCHSFERQLFGQPPEYLVKVSYCSAQRGNIEFLSRRRACTEEGFFSSNKPRFVVDLSACEKLG